MNLLLSGEGLSLKLSILINTIMGKIIKVHYMCEVHEDIIHI